MTGDDLDQYTKLIKENTVAQGKVSAALNSALSQLSEEKAKIIHERQKLESFNSSGLMRYWSSFKPVLVPVVIILFIWILVMAAALSGHPIDVKFGDTEVTNHSEN